MVNIDELPNRDAIFQCLYEIRLNNDREKLYEKFIKQNKKDISKNKYGHLVNVCIDYEKKLHERLIRRSNHITMLNIRLACMLGLSIDDFIEVYRIFTKEYLNTYRELNKLNETI